MSYSQHALTAVMNIVLVTSLQLSTPTGPTVEVGSGCSCVVDLVVSPFLKEEEEEEEEDRDNHEHDALDKLCT